MTPLRVVAPCGCEWDCTGEWVFLRLACQHVEHSLDFGSALREDPARAYDLARAGYAMAAQGIGRKAE